METQTQWLHDDGLLGRPFVYTSISGERYHTAIECYGLRNVEYPCLCAAEVL